MCLLFKTPADRKTSSSASLGKTNGPFCPKDEIWGPSRSRGSEKTLYHAAFMSLKSRTSPVVQELVFLLEVLERVADETCQGCRETSIQEKVPWQPGRSKWKRKRSCSQPISVERLS
ncbi:hypothetical protein I79_018775 [Cricetulus griseus]|uniref:Uncharacterized protein n=1 Tax=Cricetulus griseus TaxID=10029 RepID=G3I5M2_CRIGR|nr:hypothetical protein I79_018775 [Cricetulus griseus]